jgi:hypothetical protein
VQDHRLTSPIKQVRQGAAAGFVAGAVVGAAVVAAASKTATTLPLLDRALARGHCIVKYSGTDGP